MASKIPRVSVTVGAEQEDKTQAELTLLSLGFGFQQAWYLAVVFGAYFVFGGNPVVASPLRIGWPFSGLFLSLTLSAIALLAAAAITDQKLLKAYTAKSSIVAAALMAALGTLLIVPGLRADSPTAVWMLAGIVAGVGSALLSIFWGVAFSRQGAGTIVLNTGTGMVIGLAIYVALLHLPQPYAGVIAACLPIAQLPVLWKFTPISYAQKHSIPIFNPLPLKKLAFFLRFGPPLFLFGIVLGILNSITSLGILPSAGPVLLLLTLFAGGAVIIILLIVAFFMNPNSHWDAFFRMLVPIAALAVCLIPMLATQDSTVVSLVVVVGYTCLEALLWIFNAELSQEFRPSPILVFGMGRASMLAGVVVGMLLCTYTDMLPWAISPTEPEYVIPLLLLMIVANALRPHVRDIKELIDLHHYHTAKAAANIYDKASTVSWDNRRGEAPAIPAVPSTTPHAHAAAPTGSASTATQPASAQGTIRFPASPPPSGVSSGWRSASYGFYSSQHTDAPTLSHATAYAAATSPAAANAQAQADPKKPAQVGAGGTAEASSSSSTLAAAEDKVTDAASSPNAADSATEGARRYGRFRMQCEVIADRYLLSRRETEVLFLLAKGHNAAFIQDKLCVSHSTAKTHISHIYKKLDIHSQQELLKMVDGAREEAEARLA